MSIHLAIRAALKARHRNHRLGAILIKGGNIISVGWNISFKHAEHMAIDRAWRSDIEGCTIMVVRVRKNGSLGMAKPCETCMARLIDAGIKKVIYSTNDGQLETTKLSSKDYSDSRFITYPFLKPGHQDKYQQQ